MGQRVLIVEDEPLIADSLRDLLKEDGHVVCGNAKSGAAAIFLARTKRPDVVVMDVGLTGSLDGVDAAESIRSERRCGIVFLSACVTQTIHDRIHGTVPDAVVLRKPANPDEVTRAVRQVGNSPLG